MPNETLYIHHHIVFSGTLYSNCHIVSGGTLHSHCHIGADEITVKLSLDHKYRVPGSSRSKGSHYARITLGVVCSILSFDARMNT